MHFAFWWEYITAESLDIDNLIRWQIHINYLEVKDNYKTGLKSTVVVLFIEKLCGNPHGISKQECLYSMFMVSFGELHLLLKTLKEYCSWSSVLPLLTTGHRLPTDSASSQDRDCWSCFAWICKDQPGLAICVHLIDKKTPLL